MTALAALIASIACAATPVHGEALPQSGVLAGMKWVQASPHRSGIVGMLFAYDAKISGDPPRFSLWAGGAASPSGPNQKILWIVRNSHAATSIVVRGFEIGGMDGFKQRFNEVGDVSAQPAKGREYASIVNVPHAGCWRLEVSTGGAKGLFTVQVVEP